MDTGKRIKEIRKDCCLTQGDFAIKLGVTKNTIVRYEKGMRNPDSSFLYHLKEEFGVNLNWIIVGEGEKYKKEKAGRSFDSQTAEIFQFIQSSPKIKKGLYLLLKAQKTNSEIVQSIQTLKEIQKHRYSKELIRLLQSLNSDQFKSLFMVAKNMV